MYQQYVYLDTHIVNFHSTEVYTQINTHHRSIHPKFPALNDSRSAPFRALTSVHFLDPGTKVTWVNSNFQVRR